MGLIRRHLIKAELGGHARGWLRELRIWTRAGDLRHAFCRIVYRHPGVAVSSLTGRLAVGQPLQLAGPLNESLDRLEGLH